MIPTFEADCKNYDQHNKYDHKQQTDYDESQLLPVAGCGHRVGHRQNWYSTGYVIQCTQTQLYKWWRQFTHTSTAQHNTHTRTRAHAHAHSWSRSSQFEPTLDVASTVCVFSEGHWLSKRVSLCCSIYWYFAVKQLIIWTQYSFCPSGFCLSLRMVYNVLDLCLFCSVPKSSLHCLGGGWSPWLPALATVK